MTKGQIYYHCNHSSYLHRCTARSVCHYSCPHRPHSRCPVRSRPSPRCSRCSPRGCWSWRSPSPSLGRRRSSLAPLSRRDRLGKGGPPGASHHWRGWWGILFIIVIQPIVTVLSNINQRRALKGCYFFYKKDIKNGRKTIKVLIIFYVSCTLHCIVCCKVNT